jgi:hypothetical protein
MPSDNQPKSHRARNITVAVTVVVILSASLIVAIEILRPHPVGLPAVNTIMHGLITVNSNTYKVYPFTIPSDVSMKKIEGTFTVSGNNESTIKVYVMNGTSFVNWQNGDAFSTYYNSGEATTGNITAKLTSVGTYFLVYDNTFSTTPKNVDTKVIAMCSFSD